ncbi:hypothetical protein CH35J_006551 [Colletotrichum higginsianum]|uniref:Uncharacterized protein n=1 Tax=Colletotrichum higginsianum TaxID=80884 RepID=A0A4T0VYW9_9PEZI|nr:hypothetical protein CH35J_006551 [Colletotrichum higginsianum]
MDLDSHNGRRPTPQDVERCCRYLKTTENVSYKTLDKTYSDDTKYQMDYLTELSRYEKDINVAIDRKKYKDAKDLAYLKSNRESVKVQIARIFKILESLNIQFSNDVMAFYEQQTDTDALSTQSRRAQSEEMDQVAQSVIAALQCSNAEDIESVEAPITKENLTLKHDGTVYTHPECMKGVPVRKIDPKHPYWDSSWKDLAPTIENLRRFLTRPNKQPDALEEEIEINRETETILDFLESADFCPYQLVAKKYMMSGEITRGFIIGLAETMQVLKGCKTLDVPPLDWIRQRLQEIITIEGPSFDLTEAFDNFDSDPKYIALRNSNDKRTIGQSKTKVPNDTMKPKETTNDPFTTKRKRTTKELKPRKRKTTQGSAQKSKLAKVTDVQKAQCHASEKGNTTVESNESRCPSEDGDCIVVATRPRH